MNGINIGARTGLFLAIFAFVAAGCSGPAGDAPVEEAAPAPVSMPEPGAREDIGGDTQEAPVQQVEEVEPEAGPQDTGFDIESVPVSTVALGEFPYFTLPEGYRNPNRPQPVREFDRAAVWTGDRLEWVEGRIFESRIGAERGKGWSKLEVVRNLDHQVQEAGGVKVTESRPPQDVIQAWGDGQGYSVGRGDIFNHEASTWLVRRSDRNIWLHFVGTSAGGAWMVIESAAFVPTASLLPATEMKQQLEADGRVAIEVNFAVDKADILPESQPQIEQVLALLEGDPGLRLSIDGHTDATGGAAHNQSLSEARAQAVVAALVGQGVDAARLEANGYGQTRPVADNDTDEGRAKNRRVELVRL